MNSSKKLGLLASAFSAVILLGGCNSGTDARPQMDNAQASSRSEAAAYTCPMHPHYISTDKDGSCPICGMDLVPVESDASTGPSGKGDILYYKNPMGLPDSSPIPKKDSMGMDYIPVYANEITSGVAVSPEMIQTMGIKTVPVSMSRFSGDIRAFGQVEPNTRLQAASTSRFEGWIDKLSVRAEGDVVKRGSLLYRIYSPDLIGAQKEYLVSLQIGNDKRIAAVRQRLKSLGLQEGTINRLTETRELIERIPVFSDNSGIISNLNVREGDYVKAGTPILRLQSYDNVWVMAAIEEADLPDIREGMPVSLRFESTKSAPQTGVIDYIYPTIDPRTRTANVRVEVDNGDGSLRPGAYADIIISRNAGEDERLSVPTQAVLRDSQGAHVVVSLGDGRFEPRAVKTGALSNGRTEIVEGLRRGEIIVSSGQFLLDSEANLREGLAKLTAPEPSFDSMTPLSELPVDAAVLGRLDHLVDASLYFHEALIDGYPIDPYFLDPILKIAEGLEADFSGSRLAPIASDAKAAILAAKEARSGEGLADNLARLNAALDPWLTLGAPSHYKTKGLIFYSDPASGRTWLQETGLPANPYGNSGGDQISWPDPMSNMGGGNE